MTAEELVRSVAMRIAEREGDIHNWERYQAEACGAVQAALPVIVTACVEAIENVDPTGKEGWGALEAARQNILALLENHDGLR